LEGCIKFQICPLIPQRGQARVPRESLLVHSKHHTVNMATLHRTMIMILVLVVLPLVPALPAKAKSRTIQSFFSTAQQSVASASSISGRPPAPPPPTPTPPPPPPKPKTPQEVFEKNRSKYTWLRIGDEDEPSLHCAQCVDTDLDTLPDNEPNLFFHGTVDFVRFPG
jgi:hypothetical protein